MADARDPLITIAAAAREIGVDRTTLSRQVACGSIRSHDGKVRLSEVLEDRAANIDLSRTKRREGRLDSFEDGAAPPQADPVSPEAEDEEDGPPVIVDGALMSYADARAMKETYLANLKRLEFETKQGTLAPVDEMLAVVESEYSTIRERLLGIPGKLSGELDRNQVDRLTSELYEALEELSDVERAKARMFPPDAGPRGDSRENDEGTATATPPPARGRRSEGGRRA